MAGKMQQSQQIELFNTELLVAPVDGGAIIEGDFIKSFSLLLGRDKVNQIWRMIATNPDGSIATSAQKLSSKFPKIYLVNVGQTAPAPIPANTNRIKIEINNYGDQFLETFQIYFDPANTTPSIPLLPGYTYTDDVYQGNIYVSGTVGGGFAPCIAIEWSL